MAAATELLDAADSESEVTLRRIAATAGITAPAIYAHFTDREAILAAIAERGWRDVVAEIRTRAALGTTPRDRLQRGCATYVAFAQRFPMRYALDDTDGCAHPVRTRSPASRDPRAGELPDEPDGPTVGGPAEDRGGAVHRVARGGDAQPH